MDIFIYRAMKIKFIDGVGVVIDRHVLSAKAVAYISKRTCHVGFVQAAQVDFWDETGVKARFIAHVMGAPHPNLAYALLLHPSTGIDCLHDLKPIGIRNILSFSVMTKKLR